MTVMTPAQICEDLGIQGSTLRKYSLLLEAEGIEFERTHNNSRRYTDMDLVTLRKLITLTKTGSVTVEEAARMAAKFHKGEDAETLQNGVSDSASERRDDVITAGVIAELRALQTVVKEQAATIDEFRKSQEKRDRLFMEALENLQGRIETLQASLPEPKAEDDPEDQPDEPKPKKGFLARIFSR